MPTPVERRGHGCAGAENFRGQATEDEGAPASPRQAFSRRSGVSSGRVGDEGPARLAGVPESPGDRCRGHSAVEVACSQHLAVVAVDEVGPGGADRQRRHHPGWNRRTRAAWVAPMAMGRSRKPAENSARTKEDADARVSSSARYSECACALEGVLEAPDPAGKPVGEPGGSEGLLPKAHRVTSASWVVVASGAAGSCGAVAMGSGVTSTDALTAAGGRAASWGRASGPASCLIGTGARPR